MFDRGRLPHLRRHPGRRCCWALADMPRVRAPRIGGDDSMTRLPGHVPLQQVLTVLAERRPVVHSEADFQHALAWEAHRLDQDLRVRLETHPRAKRSTRPPTEPARSAEAYCSRAQVSDCTVDRRRKRRALRTDEPRCPRIRAYDVVKDVAWVARFTAVQTNCNGVVIALTNDPAYWRPVTHGRDTSASAFRLYEGVELVGQQGIGPQHRCRNHDRSWRRAIP